MVIFHSYVKLPEGTPLYLGCLEKPNGKQRVYGDAGDGGADDAQKLTLSHFFSIASERICLSLAEGRDKLLTSTRQY